ncbi:MAG: class F sortase [Candidatus Magasanikbacteria bacterium]|nr:class F sortase [Candidatus Magasanikbacteria bacterium]
MQQNILSKRAMLITVLSGVVLFSTFSFSFILKNLIHGSSTLLVEDVAAQGNPLLRVEDVADFSNQKQTSVGLPVRLKIPVIDVDSSVIPVGLTSDGAMEVPKDPDEVAWFNLGPIPGENGSAVIAGHYDWKNNIPAVFDNLHKLRKGDKISIEDENGDTTTFVVREIRTYNKDDEASDVFKLDDGNAHLNIITCTGVWDNVSKSYSKRLVVFTDKE